MELRVPHIEHGQDFTELAAAVGKLAPKFLSFLLSFVFVTIFWVTHHQLFHHFDALDASLAVGEQSVFAVSDVYSISDGTSGRIPRERFAVMFFGLTMIAAISAFVLMRWYVSYKAKLLSPEIEEMHIKAALRNGLFSIFAYAVAVCIAFINTSGAIAAYMMIPFWYLLMQRKATS